MSTEQSPLLESQGQSEIYSGNQEGEARTEPRRNTKDPETLLPARTAYTVLPVIFLGIFLANFDETIVLVSVNSIASEFNALSRSGWLITCYTFATCVAQPIYGRLSHTFGSKNVLVESFVIFLFGVGLTSGAQNFEVAFAARVISGIGGAGIICVGVIIVAESVSQRQLSSWRSAAIVCGSLGKGCGGPIGGVISDAIGWRWSFLMQIPIILVTLALVAWRLPPSPQSKRPRSESLISTLDITGAVLLCCMLTTFLGATLLAGVTSSHVGPHIVGAVLATFLLGVAFWNIEEARPDIAIFPTHVMLNPDVISSSCSTAFQTAALLITTYTIPLYYQIARDASAKQAGIYLIPPIVGRALGAFISSYIIYRTGRYKLLTLVAVIVGVIGYVLITARWLGSESIIEVVYSVAGAVATAVALSTAFMHVTVCLGPGAATLASNDAGGSIPAEPDTPFGTSTQPRNSADQPIAYAFSYTLQNLAASAGVSLATAVLQRTLAAQLEDKLRGVPDKEEIIAQSMHNLRYISSLRGVVKDIVVKSYVRSLTYIHGTCVGFAILGFVASCFMRERPI